MDWWRAKLVFIVAFSLLDAFLLWQVARLAAPFWLRPAASQASAPLPVAPARATPVYLPVLAVRTVGWQPSLARSLPLTACSPHTNGHGLVTCASGPDVISDYGGLLVFSSRRTVVGVHLSRTLAALVASRVVAQAGAPPSTVGPLRGGAWSPATQSRTFTATERYDGQPLFNGTWRVRVGRTGVRAERFWLDVQPHGAVASGSPLITPRQAVLRACRVYGAGAVPAPGAAPVLGYYYPYTRAAAVSGGGGGRGQMPGPGRRWYVSPVWRIVNRSGHVFYINATNGEPEQPADAAAGSGSC